MLITRVQTDNNTKLTDDWRYRSRYIKVITTVVKMFLTYLLMKFTMRVTADFRFPITFIDFHGELKWIIWSSRQNLWSDVSPNYCFFVIQIILFKDDLSHFNWAYWYSQFLLKYVSFSLLQYSKSFQLNVMNCLYFMDSGDTL